MDYASCDGEVWSEISNFLTADVNNLMRQPVSEPQCLSRSQKG